MVNLLERLATTVRYVTCLPVPGCPGPNSNEPHLSGLAKYLPAAGALIGLVLCFCGALFSYWHINSQLCGALLAVIWLCLTGGLHFDGLMDTADGIFSHQSIEKILEVMRDSRVGNYGVMVGFSTLLIKAACLSSLPPAPLFLALLLCPSWARWSESYAIGKFPYLRQSGMGKVWHETMEYPLDLYKGAIIPCGITIAMVFFQPLVDVTAVTIATVLSGYLSAHFLDRKLGGHTGDTYGAVVELAETGGLIVMSLLSR